MVGVALTTNGVKVKMKRRFFRLKTDWKTLDARILLLTDMKINILVQNYVFFLIFKHGNIIKNSFPTSHCWTVELEI